MVSGLLKKEKIEFSDHIAQKIFKIKGSTMLGNIEMAFKVKKFSFITNRIIGEKGGVSYFLYPSFNSEYPFFQNLKKLLFEKKFTFKLLGAIVCDIPSVFNFLWDFFVKHRLYVYKNEWYLVLHMENKIGTSSVSLSQIMDRFNQKGLSIDFEVSDETKNIFKNIVVEIENLLKEKNIKYDYVNEDLRTDKFEDEYHPFGIYSNFNTIDEFYKQYENMLVLHSGVLPRAGGINSTAAMFPIIEDFLRNEINK